MASIHALSPADQAEALALFYLKKARDLKKAERAAAADSVAAAEEVFYHEEPAVEMRELLAIAAAKSAHFSGCNKLKTDLSDFKEADGTPFIGFSHGDPLAAAGLFDEDIGTYLADCDDSRAKNEKLVEAGVSKGHAADIVTAMELFQTNGAFFIRKLGPSFGNGIDLCQITRPYYFRPCAECPQDSFTRYYQHRAGIRVVRRLTEGESAAVGAAHNNFFMRNFVSVTIAVPA